MKIRYFAVALLLLPLSAVAEIEFEVSAERCLSVLGVFPCADANTVLSDSCLDEDGDALGADVLAIVTDKPAEPDSRLRVNVADADLQSCVSDGSVILCEIPEDISGTFRIRVFERNFFSADEAGPTNCQGSEIQNVIL